MMNRLKYLEYYLKAITSQKTQWHVKLYTSLLTFFGMTQEVIKMSITDLNEQLCVSDLIQLNTFSVIIKTKSPYFGVWLL